MTGEDDLDSMIARIEGLTPAEWAKVLGADRWLAIRQSGWPEPNGLMATLVLNAAIRAGFGMPTVQDVEAP